MAFQVVYLPTRVFFVGLAGLYALAPYLYLASGKHFLEGLVTTDWLLAKGRIQKAKKANFPNPPSSRQGMPGPSARDGDQQQGMPVKPETG